MSIPFAGMVLDTTVSIPYSVYMSKRPITRHQIHLNNKTVCGLQIEYGVVAVRPWVLGATCQKCIAKTNAMQAAAKKG